MSTFSDMFYGTIGSQMGIVNQYQAANIFGCNCGSSTSSATPYGQNSYCNSIFTVRQNVANQISCAQKTAVWQTLGNNLLSGVFNIFGSTFSGLTNKGYSAISDWFTSK